MNKSKKLIDLKKDKQFLQEYVKLRNSYSAVLLTNHVNVAETKDWMQEGSVEIRGIVEDNALVGVVILYLKREGEIALFVKDPGQGMGSELLRIIEEVAEQRALVSIWGWVLKSNAGGQRTFEKNGFSKEGEKKKKFNGQMKSGILYKKYLNG